MNKKKSPKAAFFVATAFFLSGGCGLVYESLWARYLADLMGATSLSHFVVLMVFMGGLALGAVLVGRLVDRGANGLICYGWLEVGIGLYAVIFPFLFSKGAGIFYSLGSNLEMGSVGLLFLKLLIASLLITIPSVAMGGTLPAVTRYLTRSQEGLRRNISLLYAVNSLGAVVGILAGGFFLVYHYGLSGSMIYVGGFNLCLGFAALGAARFLDRKNSVDSAEPCSTTHHRREEVQDALVYQPYAAHRAMIAAGLSGFAAMALQIAWLRYFIIVLGATHSAFTIVVAAFIFGIGLGALLIRSKLVGRIPLPTMLTGVFAATATTIGLGLFFYGRLPFEIGRFLAIITHTPYGWPFYQTLKFGTCFVLMLLPAVASGMILPLCVRIVGRGSDRVGRDVGLVYAINTIGALLGIGITSQLLFRVTTLPRTLQIILLIYLATTIFLAFVLEEKGRKRILVFTAVLMVAHFVFWRPWSPIQMYTSWLKFGQNPPVRYDYFVSENNKLKIIEDLPGPNGQVTVLDVLDDDNKYRTMVINGKADASTNTRLNDMWIQMLTSHIPMLLHPSPRNVFILGLGSGITSGETLKFPEVKEVVTAELIPEVFEASKTFASHNDRFWENPKHRMVIDDGKTFLRLSKEKFDVIILEPTNIWQEGMSGLFSEDFFRLAKSRLADGGLVAQWLQTYKVDDLTVNIVLKTFSQVFPEASIFMMTPGNILLFGYNENWEFDPLKLNKRFYQTQILESQKEAGNPNPTALLLREVLSRDSFREYTRVLGAPVNTDNFPLLEQAAEYGRFIKQPVTILKGHDSRLDPDGKGLLIHDYFKQVGVDNDQLQKLVNLKVLQSDNLRESLRFKILEQLGEGRQDIPVQTLRSYVSDPQLSKIITHPTYRMSTDDMTVQEAYNMLQGELLIWQKAASQLWTPRPERMQKLYDRFATGVDRKDAGAVARNTALSLAYGRACGAAIPFFRAAEKNGAMITENMSPADIITTFYCELRAGDVEKAKSWWQIIELENIPVIDAMLADKATMDIKLGGQPPPPVYGRLPSRW